ncbi:hypothetical protein AJ80_07824 [Polytolypa hystricis UAMH7299]|uniref:Cytochrome P450 monooxygenase n=1 Tax=Polytolypa hystricis (strain UAMH7299) TaxID=1447883 RepID=A0A2B7XIW3_POLH7|nr:hypothetical protein AJ80_07824 [Polytolypa hystricis UAMH7299]
MELTSLGFYLILLAGLAWILQTSVLVIKRLYFHPLRHFPGPKLAAATYYYEVYFDWFRGPFKGSNEFHLRELHKKYGPIIRRSPDELSVEDPEWFDVLFAGGRRDKWNRSGKASSGSVQSTLSRVDHKRRRGALTRFFSKRSVLLLEDSIVDRIDVLAAGVEKHYMGGQRIFNAGVAFGALTLDVITDYCFDQSFGCLSKSDFSPEWKKTFSDMFEAIPLLRNWSFIAGNMTKLPESLLHMMNPTIEKFVVMKKANTDKITQISKIWEQDQLAKSKGDTHVSEDPGKTTHVSKDRSARTIFYDILDSKVLPLEDKSIQRMSEEAFGMVVAGGDTTGRALANLMYHIHANPEWLVRVRKELDELMPDPEKPAKLKELEVLPAFSACIKEMLRISSLITERLNLIEPVETLDYDKWAIPPGTPVGMSLVTMNMNEKVFPNPEKFDPSRWTDAKENKQELERNFVPFAKGNRGCLGLNLAYAQIHLASAILLRRFNFELYDVVRERDIDVLRDCFVGMAHPKSQGVRFKVLSRRY